MTFCLDGDSKAVYTDKTKELYLSADEYSGMLKGYSHSINEEDEKLSQILSSEHDRMTIQLQSVISQIEFKYINQTEFFSNKEESKENEDLEDLTKFFHSSYLGPEKICFTRNENMENMSGSSRIKDEIKLDFTKLQYIFESQKATFKVFVHTPGQLARNLDRPVFEMLLRDMLTT